MKRVCGWCGKDMGYTEGHPEDGEGTTHGICAECKAKVDEDIENFKLEGGDK